MTKLVDLNGLTRYNEKIKGVINNGLGTKQDTLISGTNIKTVGGTSILGSGNISVEPVTITDTEIGNLFEEELLSQKFVSQNDIQEAINTEY